MKTDTLFNKDFISSKLGKKLHNSQFFSIKENNILITALQLSTAFIFSISSYVISKLYKVMLLYALEKINEFFAIPQVEIDAENSTGKIVLKQNPGYN